MTQRPILDFVLARHLAIEQQLLAEEKWVVEALKMVKKQRNSLQIEKLHLTSELGKLVMKKKGATKKSQRGNSSADSEELGSPLKNPLADSEESEAPPKDPLTFSMDDEVCNAEELNLTVPQHTYYVHGPVHTTMDDIEELENSEIDDYEIDMNMLMYGNNQ